MLKNLSRICQIWEIFYNTYGKLLWMNNIIYIKIAGKFSFHIILWSVKNALLIYISYIFQVQAVVQARLGHLKVQSCSVQSDPTDWFSVRIDEIGEIAAQMRTSVTKYSHCC